MKQIFTIFSIALFLCASLNAQISSNGLIGYYPFNGNANDQSGNCNNLTVTGATLTTDRFGNANSAYYLNGTSNYMTVNIGDLKKFTVSFWFKDSIPVDAWPEFFMYNQFWCNTAGSGDPPYIGNVGARKQLANNNAYGTSTQYYPIINVWHNICVQYDSLNNNMIKLYADGILVSTGVYSPGGGYNNLTKNVITFGATTDLASGHFYKGYLDDVRLYNRIIDSIEIKSLYTENQPQVINLNSNVIAYYPFNGNANDLSGHGHNGTVNGATLTTDRFGNTNSAYSFTNNGSNENISIPSLTDTSKAYSLSFWYNAPVQTQIYSTPYFWQKMMWADIGGGGVYGKNQIINIPGNNGLFKLSPPVENIWHHIVVTTDYRHQLTARWIDGKKDSTWTGTGWSGLGTNAGYLSFGCETLTSSNTQYTGKLDDIRLYNVIIDSTQIKALYNEGLNFKTITVTDTLIINVSLTGVNPVTYQSTIKIYPNPARDQITINYGNISNLTGYSIKIINVQGKTVFSSPIQQEVSTINLSTWTGKGTYFVQTFDNKNNMIDVKTIILQ